MKISRKSLLNLTHSLYIRLLFTFLILFLPAYLVCLLLFSWGKNAIRREILDSAAAATSFIRQHFDTQLENLNRQIHSMLQDSNTLQNIFILDTESSESDYYLTLRSVISYLKLVQSSNDLIQEIIVYYPDYQISVSSLHPLEAIDTAALDSLLSDYRRQNSILTEHDGSFFMGRVFPYSGDYLSSDSSQRPPAFLCVLLSTETIREYLSVFNAENAWPTFLVCDDSGTCIADRHTLGQGMAPSLQRMLLHSDPDEGWISTCVHSDYGNYSFYQLIPKEGLFATPERFQFFLTLYLLMLIPVFGAYALLIYRYVRKPMNRLLQAFLQVDDDTVGLQISKENTLTEFQTLIDGFNRMSLRLEDMIDRGYKQELYMQKLEFKQLQSQINPHFLYNSFYMLRHLIQDEDRDAAARLADYLGSYFRYITKIDVTQVKFSEEYENAASYLEIQKLRFEEQLQIHMDEPSEEVKNFIIPKLTLQPLVENAVKHGIRTRNDTGIINVTLHADNAALSITVEDNGVGLDDAELFHLQELLEQKTQAPADVTAVFNIQKRVRLAFGPQYGLHFSRSPLGGMCARLLIPVDATPGREAF